MHVPECLGTQTQTMHAHTHGYACAHAGRRRAAPCPSPSPSGAAPGGSCGTPGPPPRRPAPGWPQGRPPLAAARSSSLQRRAGLWGGEGGGQARAFVIQRQRSQPTPLGVGPAGGSGFKKAHWGGKGQPQSKQEMHSCVRLRPVTLGHSSSPSAASLETGPSIFRTGPASERPLCLAFIDIAHWPGKPRRGGKWGNDL